MVRVNGTNLYDGDLTEITGVGIRRLRKLANRLDSVSKEEFDMDQWYVGESADDCGTAACALGYATTIPSFRRAGLREYTDTYNKSWSPGFTDKYGYVRVGTEAGVSFFQCSSVISEVIFMPASEFWAKATPRVVAAGIRRICNGAEKAKAKAALRR